MTRFRSLKAHVRDWIEVRTGLRVFRALPRGLDVLYDLQTTGLLDPLRLRVVFDVGANVGQSAMVFLRSCPEARIWCFEPVSTTFRELERQFQNEARVRCRQLGLSDQSGLSKMLLEGPSDMYRIEAVADNRRTEQVHLSTLDELCSVEEVTHIDFLKIDAEGHDYKVLCGAQQLISQGRIGAVQVEASMTPMNRSHVPLEVFKAYLESYGYYLFGIYEQYAEWQPLPPLLRRSNAVFVGPGVHGLKGLG